MSRPELLYLVPGAPPEEPEQEHRRAVASERSPIDVTVAWAGTGPRGIESAVDEAWSLPGLLQAAAEREAEVDAVVVGCFGDTGLRALRELLSVPVVGPAETTVHAALELADRFSWLTPLDRTVPMSRAKARELGVADALASVRALDLPIEEMERRKDALAEAMFAAGRDAVAEDGAEALVPGCMSLAFGRQHEAVAERLSVPLLDPLALSLERATTLVRLGLGHSERTYPPVDRDQLTGLLD